MLYQKFAPQQPARIFRNTAQPLFLCDLLFSLRRGDRQRLAGLQFVAARFAILAVFLLHGQACFSIPLGFFCIIFGRGLLLTACLLGIFRFAVTLLSILALTILVFPILVFPILGFSIRGLLPVFSRLILFILRVGVLTLS